MADRERPFRIPRKVSRRVSLLQAQPQNKNRATGFCVLESFDEHSQEGVAQLLQRIAERGPSFQSRGVRTAYAAVLAAQEQQRRVSVEEQKELKTKMEQVRERAKNIEFAQHAADDEQQHRVADEERNTRAEKDVREASVMTACRTKDAEKRRLEVVIANATAENHACRDARIAFAKKVAGFEQEQRIAERESANEGNAASRHHSAWLADNLMHDERNRRVSDWHAEQHHIRERRAVSARLTSALEEGERNRRMIEQLRQSYNDEKMECLKEEAARETRAYGYDDRKSDNELAGLEPEDRGCTLGLMSHTRAWLLAKH